MWHMITGTLLLLTALEIPSATTPRASCTALLNRGRAALDNHRFAVAATAFDELVKNCASTSQRPIDHPFTFYAALARQLLASDPNISPSDRANLLVEAADLYSNALAAAPEDRSSLNNLAEVYADLGRRDDAHTMFERALAAGGAKTPWFIATYARFLVNTGDYGAATPLLNEALAQQPSLLEAQLGLFELTLSKDGPQAAIQQLAALAIAQPENAVRVALEGIGSPKVNKSEKELLFAIAISSMASQVDKGAASTDVLRDLLNDVSHDTTVGEGARELLALLDDNADPGSFRWWTALKANAQVWHAFHSFVLATALLEAHERDYPHAASNYYLLRKLEYPEVSVEPILGLAELYAGTGDAHSFINLQQRYDSYMKDDTSSDLATLHKRYDYHRELVALGDTLIESSCANASEAVTAPPNVQSPLCGELAKLVLTEVARSSAALSRYNSAIASGDSSQKSVAMDGGIYAAAATAYNALGEGRSAVSSRLVAADVYAKTNNNRTASRQLDIIERDGLTRLMSSDEQTAFDRLRQLTASASKKK